MHYFELSNQMISHHIDYNYNPSYFVMIRSPYPSPWGFGFANPNLLCGLKRRS